MCGVWDMYFLFFPPFFLAGWAEFHHVVDVFVVFKLFILRLEVTLSFLSMPHMSVNKRADRQCTNGEFSWKMARNYSEVLSLVCFHFRI